MEDRKETGPPSNQPSVTPPSHSRLSWRGIRNPSDPALYLDHHSLLLLLSRRSIQEQRVTVPRSQPLPLPVSLHFHLLGSVLLTSWPLAKVSRLVYCSRVWARLYNRHVWTVCVVSARSLPPPLIHSFSLRYDLCFRLGNERNINDIFIAEWQGKYK